MFLSLNPILPDNIPGFFSPRQRQMHVQNWLNNICLRIGNTLLLIENNADKKLSSASVVNGNYLRFNSINYFSADQRLNFGIGSISEDNAQVVYYIGPSSASQDPLKVKITLGGLLKNTAYSLIKEKVTTGTEFKTDQKGQAVLSLEIDVPSRIIAIKRK